MTTLPERLRASAQEMSGLFLVSENVPNVRMIYKEDRDRIARELEEAAQALEAQQRDDAGVAQALPAPKLCPRCCQYHGPICPAGVREGGNG